MPMGVQIALASRIRTTTRSMVRKPSPVACSSSRQLKFAAAKPQMRHSANAPSSARMPYQTAPDTRLSESRKAARTPKLGGVKR